LLSQRNDRWSWNYVTREEKDAKVNTFPDDLDATFCSLAALSNFDKSIITPEVFAHVVDMLTMNEKKEGGPYRTWLVGKKSAPVWRDVDFAVNANIAYFLSLHDITVPNLTKYFDRQLKTGSVISSYYPSCVQPLYFLSRFYNGKLKEKIVHMLHNERTKGGQWKNPLDAAMGILTFFHLGVENNNLKKDIAYLLQTRKKDSWDAYGFCIDPSRDGKKYFAGSSALTTVFCLRALYEYQKRQKIYEEHGTNNKKEEKKYYDEIVGSVSVFFSNKDRLTKKHSLHILDTIIARDTKKHIPLFPYLFYQTLGIEKEKIPPLVLEKLGMINIFGWIAYTIYDDFLDGEGNPVLLSIATFSLRAAIDVISSFDNKEIQQLFFSAFDIVDAANAWEITHCRDRYHIPKRFPSVKLAEKSFGHIVGPLAILILLGITKENKEYQYIKTFFIHFLIAKQLNDDAHDVFVDLKKEQITPVVALLLKKASEKKKQTFSALRQLFWGEVIEEVCHLIYDHVKKARRALQQSSIIQDKTYLEEMVAVYEQAATTALEERNKTRAFLKSYHNK
ncbi:MAG TPA: class 1 isoprenoid biosynthesis enzyme, partial [Patescibacteria group bacterium]|nr:class 1 isoprenoid biosynthesis enzyme [Patescibacteria group bacterium]